MIGAAMNVLEFQKMKEEDARFPQAPPTLISRARNAETKILNNDPKDLRPD